MRNNRTEQVNNFKRGVINSNLAPQEKLELLELMTSLGDDSLKIDSERRSFDATINKVSQFKQNTQRRLSAFKGNILNMQQDTLQQMTLQVNALVEVRNAIESSNLSPSDLIDDYTTCQDRLFLLFGLLINHVWLSSYQETKRFFKQREQAKLRSFEARAPLSDKGKLNKSNAFLEANFKGRMIDEHTLSCIAHLNRIFGKTFTQKHGGSWYTTLATESTVFGLVENDLYLSSYITSEKDCKWFEKKLAKANIDHYEFLKHGDKYQLVIRNIRKLNTQAGDTFGSFQTMKK